MKLKFIFPLVLAIIIGFLSAKIVYAFYNHDDYEKFNAYVLMPNDIDSEKLKTIDYYITIDDEILCGITKDIKNANKLKKVYESKNIKVDVEKIYIDDNEFLNNLEQYDILLSGVDKDVDLLSITKVILSSYEDMVLNT